RAKLGVPVPRRAVPGRVRDPPIPRPRLRHPHRRQRAPGSPGGDPGRPGGLVDVDPVAVAHSQALLTDKPYAVAVRADLRDVPGMLALPQVRELIDFTH